jgi:tRNA dimethylallyltransferase
MNKILVVCGPTATGKSSLAVKLAKKFNGEIISADSRQVYRGLDIGSGKITEEEKQGVEHYLLDMVNPEERFSSAQYAILAKEAIEEIVGKNKLPILCGGTGFYLQSAVDNLITPKVKPDWVLRSKLEKLGVVEMQERLKKNDIKRWERMNESDRQNPRRLIRALEIIEKTGKPTPILGQNRQEIDLFIIGITAPPEIIKELIRKRLMTRLDNGMVEEIEYLISSGITFSRLDELGLEYRWLGRYKQGKITYEEMTENIFKDSYDFSRRQMTWFKKDKRIKWFDITSQNWEKEVEEKVNEWYNADKI